VVQSRCGLGLVGRGPLQGELGWGEFAPIVHGVRHKLGTVVEARVARRSALEGEAVPDPLDNRLEIDEI
jgi:hypothetical protein